MIKIVNGVFGYNNGKNIIPKTPKDKPFECDTKTEKRLVSLGVAEYVTAAEVDVDTDDKEVSREELIAQFKAYGLKGNPSTMKTETLKAKVADAAKEAEEVEVDEDAPSFDEEDGVVN